MPSVQSSAHFKLSYRLQRIVSCISLLWLSSAAQAGGIQSLDSIRTAAEAGIRNLSSQTHGTLYVSAEPLDSRLRLAQCAAPLESFLPNGANLGVRATVAVRCTQGAEWTLYVPVNIEVEATVLTLAHDAAKDSVLGADDVKVGVRRLPGMRASYLSEAEQLKGLRLARSLVSGTVLSADMLTQALVIRRGQEVTLLASVGGIEVRMRGTALMDGAANSRIQVRNGATSRVVEGVVDGDAVVRVVL